MDEGKLHDRLGKEGDFSNSIVLFTSNVGSEWLTRQLESGNVPPTTQIMEVMGQYFRPEFLARLSEIVPFFPIREEILLKYSIYSSTESENFWTSRVSASPSAMMPGKCSPTKASLPNTVPAKLPGSSVTTCADRFHGLSSTRSWAKEKVWR